MFNRVFHYFSPSILGETPLFSVQHPYEPCHFPFIVELVVKVSALSIPPGGFKKVPQTTPFFWGKSFFGKGEFDRLFFFKTLYNPLEWVNLIETEREKLIHFFVAKLQNFFFFFRI